MRHAVGNSGRLAAVAGQQERNSRSMPVPWATRESLLPKLDT